MELQSDSGESFFISEVEFESFPNIYRTSRCVFANLMNEGSDSEEVADKLTVHQRHEKGEEFFAYLNGTCALYNSDGYTEFYENAASSEKTMRCDLMSLFAVSDHSLLAF